VDVPEVGPDFHARLLVVDADDGSGCELALALEAAGFETTIVRTADAALTSLREHPFDVALIDLMLPTMNGLELCRAARQLQPLLRVVLTCAYHLSERQLRRSACGASAFVPKPYDARDVAAFLRAKLAEPRSWPPSAPRPDEP
jgi:DNA-binding response OmpR family regulator